MFFDTPSESEESFVLVSPGVYRMKVQDTDLKPNKAQTGRLAVVAFSILQGEFKGQTVTAFFNIEHHSEKAQKIGRAEFKKFLAACGVTEALKYDNDFHRAVKDKELYVEVENEPVGDKIFAKPTKYASQPPDYYVPPSQPQRDSDVSDVPF